MTDASTGRITNIRNVFTGSLLEHPDEWERRLLDRYYEAMYVSLEIWMRQHGWPNPDDASTIVGDWFDRERAGDNVPPGGQDAIRAVEPGWVDSETPQRSSSRGNARVRFATLRKFREKLDRDEAQRREAHQLQADLERMTDDGGHAEPCSVPAPSLDAPTRRRRFRDYLFRALVNFAWDWRRRANREAGLLDGEQLDDACSEAAYREWTAEQAAEGEAKIPLAVALGWDVSQSLGAFAHVLGNFKGLAAAIKPRGKKGELPSWWTMMEITTLRPLLSGCPAASGLAIAHQYGFDKGEKQVRNTLASMWRHIRSCASETGDWHGC